MSKILLKNARIINEGAVVEGDILIEDERINKIGPSLTSENAKVLDVRGNM